MLCTDVDLTLSMSQYAHSELPGQRRCFRSILDRSSHRTLIGAADVLVWNTASDLGPVAFAFPLLDDRWCNCGVKQPASDWPPSDSLCTQTQPTPSDRVDEKGALAARSVAADRTDLRIRVGLIRTAIAARSLTAVADAVRRPRRRTAGGCCSRASGGCPRRPSGRCRATPTRCRPPWVAATARNIGR